MRWLGGALERRHEAALTVQARLLCSAGRLWVEQWETDPTALLQESLALHRQLDDKGGMALSLCWLGWCDFRFRRDAVTPAPLWEEGLALARQVDDKLLMSWLYHGLAWIAMARGHSVEAAKLSARGLELTSVRTNRRPPFTTNAWPCSGS